MDINEVLLKGLKDGIYCIGFDKTIRIPSPILFWSKTNKDYCLSYEMRNGKKLYFFMRNYNTYWALERTVLERRKNG